MSIQAIAKALSHLPVGATIKTAANGSIGTKYVSRALRNGVVEFDKVIETGKSKFTQRYLGTELYAEIESNPLGRMETIFGGEKGYYDKTTQIFLNNGKKATRLGYTDRPGKVDFYGDKTHSYQEAGWYGKGIVDNLIKEFEKGFDLDSQIARMSLKW